jgi:hypothetical protein
MGRLRLLVIFISCFICGIFNIDFNKGALLTQLIPPFSALDEANLLAGTLLYQLLVSTTFITLARLGSSQILFFTGLSQAAALVYIYFMKTARHVPFFAYLIWQVTPVLIGTEVSFAVFDFFVPLVSTGCLEQL